MSKQDLTWTWKQKKHFWLQCLALNWTLSFPHLNNRIYSKKKILWQPCSLWCNVCGNKTLILTSVLVLETERYWVQIKALHFWFEIVIFVISSWISECVSLLFAGYVCIIICFGVCRTSQTQSRHHIWSVAYNALSFPLS